MTVPIPPALTGPACEAARARWTVTLKCGHKAGLGGNPRPGHYITCVDLKCQSQQRITAIEPAPSLPVVYVQDALFAEVAA